MSKIILLTRGYEAIVDDEHYDWLNQWNWRFDGRYAVRNIPRDAEGHRRKEFMHRVVLNNPQGMIDHINRYKLDNRRINLRIATNSQNLMNTPKRSRECSSCYKGVYFNKRIQKWCSRITVNGNHFYLGSFRDQVSAAYAYDAKAREVFQEFAYLNFPDT